MQRARERRGKGGEGTAIRVRKIERRRDGQ